MVMAKKHFKEIEGGYEVVIRHENSGRVKELIWETIVVLDYDFNMVSFSKNSGRGREQAEPDHELAQAVTYAKGQVKKRSSGEDRLYDVICRDANYGHFYKKKVHKTKSGGFNSREAETRPELIAELTPQIEDRLEVLKPYDEEILELELRLSKLRGEQRKRRDDIADEIFKRR